MKNIPIDKKFKSKKEKQKEKEKFIEEKSNEEKEEKIIKPKEKKKVSFRDSQFVQTICVESWKKYNFEHTKHYKKNKGNEIACSCSIF